MGSGGLPQGAWPRAVSAKGAGRWRSRGPGSLGFQGSAGKVDALSAGRGENVLTSLLMLKPRVLHQFERVYFPNNKKISHLVSGISQYSHHTQLEKQITKLIVLELAFPFSLIPVLPWRSEACWF